MPQFGAREPGRTYRDRPAAFGIADRDGLIAVVRVRPAGGGDWLDLPGGAVDPGGGEPQAVGPRFGRGTRLGHRARPPHPGVGPGFRAPGPGPCAPCVGGGKRATGQGGT